MDVIGARGLHTKLYYAEKVNHDAKQINLELFGEVQLTDAARQRRLEGLNS